MSDFGQILGNSRNIEYFNEAAKQGKLSHAYIIYGQKGSGKNTFASYVSAGLLCEKGGAQPCGTCASCIKAKSGNHPDIIYLNRKKEGLIAVDEIREQVNHDISIKPYYGPYKIYIIRDAELMNANSQNALLKTIEEPPSYGIIFLLTDNSDGLLETVRSRCLKIDMEALDENVLKTELKKAFSLDDKTLGEVAAFVRGNLGKAKTILEEGSEKEEKDLATDILRDIPGKDAVMIYDLAKEAEKTDLKKLLEIFNTWYRDILVLKAGGSEEDLYFLSEKDTLKEQSKRLSFEDLNDIFKEIKTASDELNANVKAEAVVEALLLEIREKLRS